MKLQGFIRASLALAVAACSWGREGALSATEWAEFGVCGANADPVTGVICTASGDTAPHPYSAYAGSEVFVKDGFDYVRCTWTVSCRTTYTASSDGGTACLSVIGTGCPAPQTTTASLNSESKLPPGTQQNGVDDYCKSHEPQYLTYLQFCRSQASNIEQYEDLCCVPRQPDGGISFDASPDANADAAVDAGADAAVDAGWDAGVDAGWDAAIDAGWDAGSDAGWDAGFDAGAGSDSDVGFDALP